MVEPVPEENPDWQPPGVNGPLPVEAELHPALLRKNPPAEDGKSPPAQAETNKGDSPFTPSRILFMGLAALTLIGMIAGSGNINKVINVLNQREIPGYWIPDQWNDFFRDLNQALNHAEAKVIVQTTVIGDQDFANALVRVRERGLRVIVIVDGFESRTINLKNKTWFETKGINYNLDSRKRSSLNVITIDGELGWQLSGPPNAHFAKNYGRIVPLDPDQIRILDRLAQERAAWVEP
jgi:hypothetical protein